MVRRFSALLQVLALTWLVGAGSARGGISLERVGQWGGATYTVKAGGELAYAGVGPRLVVLDVADPTNPVKLGQSMALPSVVMEVLVLDHYAYVADGYGGLEILNVSNPTEPAWVGEYPTDRFFRDLDVAWPYAYVVVDWDGLEIFDISSPTAPVLIGTYHVDSNAWRVAVSKGYAYLSCWGGGEGGIMCIDVSDPSKPIWKSTYSDPNVEDIVIQGNYLYVASYYTGLHVLDITVPWAPVHVGAAPVADGDAEALAVAGSRAYVGDNDDFEIFDISEPGAVAWLGAFDGFNWLQGASVAANRAYVADWSVGLKVLDVADPTNPKWLATYDEVGHALTVGFANGYAYVGGATEGVQIVDASDPAAPVRAATADTGGGAGYAFAGNYAYVAAGSNGLIILDVSDASAPVQIGSLKTKSKALEVALAEPYAYIADHVAGLTVLDIHDPAAPAWVTTYDTGLAYGVAVRDDYVYVADTQSGLVILRLDGSQLTLVGQCATTGSARDLVLDGNYAYVAAWTKGVDVIDISVPSDPKHISGYPDIYCAQKLALAGDYLLVAGSGFVFGLDVSKPSQPVSVLVYDTGGAAEDLVVAGGYLYIADNVDGLTIAAIHLPGDLNCDGRMNAFDIDPFVLTLTDPAGYDSAYPDCDRMLADINGDGKVDAFDIDPFVDLLTGG